MARVGDPRPPAEPTTDEQHARRDRLLRVAARLGSKKGLEHVQMQEIAQEAGVALGTLYRYYPSKHHLFAGVLAGQVAGIGPPAGDVADPVAAVSELVAGACRGMLRRPLLARAMITSVNVVRAESGAQGDVTFRDLIVATAGITAPTIDDLRLARLVEQCAYGVLTWAVAGESTADEAEADLRTACRLLLTPDWG
ncbi:MAG: putative transcriptional regulator, TetR family protein [Nocardioides sp.]|nr:putative transcriptional regulator, TetR family protein [Nocardioides sp.]